MNRILRQSLSLLLALVMIFSSLTAVFAAETSDFSDFPTGWSREAMTAAVNNGLLTGMGDGTIAPKDNLTRAQMAAIINRAFGATVKEDISNFTDVAADKWYYDDIAKAVNMETFAGVSGTEMNPDSDITRQEVFAVIARALVLDAGDSSALSEFSDGSTVASWAVSDVSALIERGYVNGYTDGLLCPTANITREEFAQVMHNIFKTYISEPGEVSEVNASDCVMIRTPGVTIKDVEIEGDLVLGDGVGVGDVNITNVKIGGRLLCRGGEGKVTLSGTTTGEGVVVKDVNGVVNFNNYRSESVFDGVREITRATYLHDGSSSGGEALEIGPVRFPNGGSSGGTTTPVTYDVSFYDDSSLSNKITTVKVTDGSSLGTKMPADPERDEYVFDGWYYKDANGIEHEFTSATTVRRAYSVYAKWSAAKKTVRVYADPEKTKLIDELDIPVGSKLLPELPEDPNETGKDFDGWYYKDKSGNEKKVDGTTEVTDDMDVYAKWNATVKFYKNNTLTEQVGDSVSVEAGKSFSECGKTLPAAPDNNGLRFAGWYYKDTDGSVKPLTEDTVINQHTNVFAQWGVAVTFYTDSTLTEISGSPVVVEEGKALGDKMPAALTSETAEFAGWFYKASDGSEAEFAKDTPVNANTSVYAKWNINVKFYKDSNLSEQVGNTLVIGKGEKVGTLPEEPVSGTDSFAGWYYEDPSDGLVKKLTIETKLDKHTVVYAKWGVVVTFYSDGAQIGNPVEVEKNTALGDKMPADLTSQTAEFAGWFYNAPNGAETKFTRDTPVSTNTSVYAKWNINVKFYKDSTLSEQLGNTVVIGKGEKVGTLPEEPVSGTDSFAGWYYEDPSDGLVKEFTAETRLNAHTVVYAKWGVVVTFYSDGAQIGNPVEVEKNTALGDKMPADLTSETAEFVGWFYVNESGTEVEFTKDTVVSSKTSVYAKWNVRVKYYKDVSLAEQVGNDVVTEKGKAVTELPAGPSNGTYIFAGWYYVDAENKEVEFTASTAVNANTSVYAKWNVTVRFYMDSSFNEKAAEDVIVAKGSGISLDKIPAAPANGTDDFAGWFYVNESGTETAFVANTLVNDDMQIFAKWGVVVTFYNDSTLTAQLGNPVALDKGATIGDKMPENPKSESADFAGWFYVNKSGTEVPFNADTAVDSKVDVYAKWNITVRFYMNSTVTEQIGNDVVIEKGTAVGDKLPADPTNGNDDFAGWYYINSEGTVTAFDDTTRLDTHTDVFAQWGVAVTFYKHYDETAEEPYITKVGEPVIVNKGGTFAENGKALPEVSDDSLTFVGWYYIDKDGNEAEFTSDVKVSSNLNVFAKWNATVRFYSEYSYESLEKSYDVEYGSTTPSEEFPAGYTVPGYRKNSAVDSVYTEDYIHRIASDWWYLDDNGEWAVFDENVEVKRDIDTFSMVKYVSANIGGSTFVDKFGNAVTLTVPYNSETRLNDSVKDFVFLARNTVEFAIDETDAYNKLIDKLASVKYKVIDSEGNILNQEYDMQIVEIIDVDEIEAEIEEYLTTVVENGGDELRNLLSFISLEDLVDIIEDADISDHNNYYDERDRDEVVEKIVEIVTGMDSEHKRQLVDDVIDKLQSLTYYQEFMDSFRRGDDTFVVNQETISFVMGVATAVRNYTFDMLKDRIYAIDGLEEIIKYIGEDVVSGYLDTAVIDYYDGAVEIRDMIEADKAAGVSKDYEYKTSITFRANLLNDVVVPKYNEIMAKVKSRLESADKGDYNNNLYLKALVEKNLIDELLDKTPGGATKTLSGYKLKDDPLAYYDFMYSVIVLADDAMLHYDYISYDEAYDAIAPFAVKSLNKALDILKDFNEDGSLPGGIDGKLQSIDRVKDYYDTFEALLNTVADKIIGSELDKEYTEGELKVDMVNVATRAINAFWNVFNEYEQSGELPEKLKPVLEKSAQVKEIFEKYKDNIDTLVEKLAKLKINHTYTEEEVAAYEQYVQELYEMFNGTGDPVLNVDRVYEIAELFIGDLMAEFKTELTAPEGYVYEDAYKAAKKGIEAILLRYFN